ncbi:MAG: hypothetical protein LUE17_16430 [Planctomycetaceae bacterium]|nr:hypothetical protein [Planctomycetaceae bacterium]
MLISCIEFPPACGIPAGVDAITHHECDEKGKFILHDLLPSLTKKYPGQYKKLSCRRPNPSRRLHAP